MGSAKGPESKDYSMLAPVFWATIICVCIYIYMYVGP